MSDEFSKTAQGQSIQNTVLQIINSPSGEAMTPQMLLGLVGLLDLAGILDYLHGNSGNSGSNAGAASPPALNPPLNPGNIRADAPPSPVAPGPAAANNAALLNTLMSLVGSKNGKINPSVLPLLLNMLSTKTADSPAPSKQEPPDENKE